MRRGSRPAHPLERAEARLAWGLAAPALLAMAAVAVFPLAYTFWESLHLHDLRTPWRGRPFVGLAHYAELAGDPRFWEALAHTLGFTAVSVALELALGLALALALHRALRGLGAARTLALLPWALPTVVAALLWRFLFDGPDSLANHLAVGTGLAEAPLAWLAHPLAAWVPVVLADVWKTAPFVVLLLLTGLQSIDPALWDAARLDGAGPWQRLRHVTLPLLRPALLVALVFRSLDAFRVFDLVYALTGGGPGTATEPLALYGFETLFRSLRFGYGSALSLTVFAATFGLALAYVRWLGRGLLGEEA